MLRYKVILFDLWDTLTVIPNLDVLCINAENILGKDRYTQMRKHFLEWHTRNTSKEEFIKNLDKEIHIVKQELPVINDFISLKLYEKFPETDEVLKSLKDNGVKLVLVTNSPPSSKDAFEKMNLGAFFDKTIFSCDVAILKPNKEIYLQAISGFNIEPHEALMVGDSLKKDVLGAINAGLNAILIDRTGLVEYKNKITNLKELLL